MFYLYELLIRINTPHLDKSFDHRQLLTDVNDFSAHGFTFELWRLFEFYNGTARHAHSGSLQPKLLSVSDTFGHGHTNLS